MFPAEGELKTEATHTERFGQYWTTSQSTPETLFTTPPVTSLYIDQATARLNSRPGNYTLLYGTVFEYLQLSVDQNKVTHPLVMK